MRTVKLLERRRMKQYASRNFALMLMSAAKTKERVVKRSKEKEKKIPSNKSCFHLNKEAKDNRLGYLGDQEDYFSMATSVVCDNAAVRGFELLKLSGNVEIDWGRDRNSESKTHRGMTVCS